MSLKRSLLYSYQAATAVLADGREFRCLINPDKLKPAYDNKIISIPFKDIRLNPEQEDKEKTTMGEEEIGMKPGDVFLWKETNTYWLVYLRYIEEDAYFRAEIRRCDTTVTINDNEQHIYLEGPTETTLPWNYKKGVSWNDMNYGMELYITKNEETEAFFHRFSKIKIDKNNWEVYTVNPYYGDGIIQVHIGETFNNTIEDKELAEAAKSEDDTSLDAPYISVPATVKPYDSISCAIENADGGIWVVNSNKVSISNFDDTSITLNINYGRSFAFDLIYKRENEEDIVKTIKVEPF